MKQHELRFGNLILGEYFNDQDIECEETVKFLGYDPHEQWYWVEGSRNIERYSGFKPIPLTEEWLLKFGFDKTDGFYRIALPKKGNIWFNSETYSCELGTKEGYSFAFVDCKTVHSLQNLYFALTGEELTIK